MPKPPSKVVQFFDGDLRAGSLQQAIYNLCYERGADTLPVSTVIGILEMVKLELWQDIKQ